MIEIIVNSWVHAYVSQQIYDSVKQWLNGTDCSFGPERQLAKEFEAMLSVSGRREGKVIIFNANALPGGKLLYEDGGNRQELMEWLKLHDFSGNLIVLSAFHPHTLKEEMFPFRDRFPKLLYADKKDVPLELLY